VITSSRFAGSARLRILGWSIALLVTALAATAAVTHVLLAQQLQRTVAADLANEINEFRALALAHQISPARAPGQVRSLLTAGASRTLSQSGTVLVGLTGNRIVASSSTSSAALMSRDRALLASWAAIRRPVSGSAQLAVGQIHYTAIPVRVAGDPTHGVFVAIVLTSQPQATVDQATRLQLEVGAVALAMASVLAWIVSGRVLSPIRDTTELAQRITETDLSGRIPIRGRGEISELSLTINGMLDRLEATFTAQRRFLADAGHELRTPIAIIQGNLDTIQTADPEDAETLAIAADELTRMSRLVGDLLLLAGSERPGFLCLEPVDLEVLTTTLAAKARVLDDRPFVLTGTAQGKAVLDAQRITQAVMQLAANAAAHTPAGTAVELASAVQGSDLVFSVTDHGSGVPVAHRQRIFDRFARLDTRRTDGGGLGLSIVAAIVSAHGGTVGVSDAPGGGASFRIVIPHRDQGTVPGSVGQLVPGGQA